MRIAVAMDFFATLTAPATFCYICYLIINSIVTKEVPTLTLYVLAATYGVQVVIFLMKRQFAHIGWMIISILAMPLFNFILPAYSFWNFDDFSWGNTRLIVGENKSEGHGNGEEGPAFDVKSIPIKKWDDYVNEVQKTSNYSNDEIKVSDSASQRGYGSRPASPHYPPMQEVQLRPLSSHGSRLGGNGNMESDRRSLYSNASVARSNVALSSLGYNTNPSLALGRPTSSYGMPPRGYNGSNDSLNMGLGDRTNNRSTTNLLRSESQLRMADSIDDAPIGNTVSNFPSDKQISHQVRVILSKSDLSLITKRKVREELAAIFGHDMSVKRDFINTTIDSILSAANVPT